MTFASVGAVIRVSVVTIVALVLAVFCWMSGFDRMTADSPRLQGSYFGGRTAAQFTFDNLAQKDFRSAFRQAQWAVRTDPLDPASTSALGSALLAFGRATPAYAAFTVAGGLGWRDIPTQLYWLTQGVAMADVKVVKPRLDALLRLDIDNDAVSNSLNLLERTRAGQAALATLLMEDPPWESRFLLGTSKLDGDDFDGRMAVIDLAAAKGAVLDCGAVGNAANHLITAGRVQAAKELWRRACDRAGDLYLSNGSFEAGPAKLSEGPFAWRLQARAGLDVDIASAPAPLEGYALRIASSMTVRTVAARQLTALRAGRYRLAWKTVRDGGNGPDDSIEVLIRCNGTNLLNMNKLPAPVGRANQVIRTLIIPSQNCFIQAVDIQKGASGSGNVQAGWIDDIQISPLVDEK